MNQAGIVVPCASFRRPVSISWLISTFTSVTSPTAFARIFIGSAMTSSSASAQRDFDFLGRDVVLAVGLDQCVDVRRLCHLDARRQRRLGPRRNVEYRSEHVRILFDQN